MRTLNLVCVSLLAGAVVAVPAPGTAYGQEQGGETLPVEGFAGPGVDIGEEGLGGVGAGTGRRVREDVVEDTGFGPEDLRAGRAERARADAWERAAQLAEARRLGSEQVGMQDLEQDIRLVRERLERRADYMLELSLEERERLEKARDRIEKREDKRWDRAREAGESTDLSHAWERLDPDVREQLSAHDRARLRMYARAAIAEGYSRGVLARLVEGEARRLARRTGPASNLYGAEVPAGSEK